MTRHELLDTLAYTAMAFLLWLLTTGAAAIEVVEGAGG